MVDTMLAENEITADSFARLCRNALIKTEPSNLCDLFAYPEELKTFVNVDGENKRVDLRAYFQLDERQPRVSKLELINSMNREYLVARFYLAEDDILACASIIPFDDGVSPYFLTSGLQVFAQTVHAAVTSLDVNNLIL